MVKYFHFCTDINERNVELEISDENFIFINAQFSTRLTSSSINKYLYGMCDELNVSRKSSHKIRKTYISSLFDAGLNINKIREIAGHEDERTSLNNYCFDRNIESDTELALEKIGKKSCIL